MHHDELFYILALTEVEGIGDIGAKKLISQCGSAKNVFESKLSHLQSIDGIGKIRLKNLRDKSVFERAEKEMGFIEKNNIQTYYFSDANYPARLKHCIDSPLLLFGSGNIDLVNKKIISIVGTRQITSYGMDVCKNLLAELAPLDPVIVSGFAYGVDIVAHTAAMDLGLQTIGVLAHGLNQVYPKTHKKYVAKMEEHGGFLTEFGSSTNPDKENFVKRNRIVAGISEATIVIESAEKGGSLITANIANDYNRDVFAVPGRITDKYSQGCNNLIRTQRANLLHSAADLIYILNWDIQESSKPVQKQLFVELDATEQLVYNFLQSNGKETIDNIALECQMPVFKLSSLLLNMELKGVVRPLPGKLFEAI